MPTFQLLRLAPWDLMRNGVAAFNGILVGTVISSLYPGVYGVERSLAMWLFIVFGSLARYESMKSILGDLYHLPRGREKEVVRVGRSRPKEAPSSPIYLPVSKHH